MLTLSHGFLKPQNGDRGSVWFPALASDIQKLNDHDHNGVNSEALSSSNISGGSVLVLAAGWVLVDPGIYHQVVTTPAGFNMDNHIPSVRLTSSGDILYLTIKKITPTSFDIFINDNSLDLTVVFR